MMNHYPEHIVSHLFQHQRLEQVPLESIQQMAEKNPSFAVAQFMLLKKMKSLHHPGFDNQLRKAALYFNNPLWLRFLLQAEEQYEEEINKQEVIQSISKDNLSIEHNVEINNEPEPVLSQLPIIKAQEITAPEVDAAILKESLQNSTPIETSENNEFIVNKLATEVAEMKEKETANNNGAVIEEEVEITIEKDAAKKNLLAEIRKIIEPEAVLNNDHEEEDPVPAETTPIDNHTLIELNVESAIKNNIDGELQKLAAEIQSLKKEEDNKKEEVSVELPIFQPYHTVDYFASQGIKLDKMVEHAQDRFGQQLKSFTDWIKSMKRLPQTLLQKKLDGNDNTLVIADAASSLQEKETITEAMAEVYEKQGLRSKAVFVYQKLSLQNPDKSHYFAAKIDALKKFMI